MLDPNSINIISSTVILYQKASHSLFMTFMNFSWLTTVQKSGMEFKRFVLNRNPTHSTQKMISEMVKTYKFRIGHSKYRRQSLLNKSMIGLSLLRVIFKYISVQTYFSFLLIQTLVRKSNLPNDSYLQQFVCKLWDHVLLGLTGHKTLVTNSVCKTT